MADKAAVLDQPWQIEIMRLHALRLALRLQVKTGLRHSKVDVPGIVRREMGSGSRNARVLLVQFTRFVRSVERQVRHRYMTSTFAEQRYPRLIKSMCWVAGLNLSEASCALRDWQQGFRDIACGGEAVQHYGGLIEVVRVARLIHHPCIVRVGISNLPVNNR